MKNLSYSFVIPVYNRPDELDELLESLTQQKATPNFEVVVVEDGSSENAAKVVEKYRNKLNIKYLDKENTGAGLSRNFGMKNASGNYFIILDSDVILPPTYLQAVDSALQQNYTDAFGGPDDAHKSFSALQKAINFSMTSFLTTGGLRGGKHQLSKYQARSYNMGLSKKAFQKTGGYSDRKIGEDIALSQRLWQEGFDSQYIDEAVVYHKRRSTMAAFFKQVYRFGKERPKLNREFPGSAKLTYWFPSLFIIGLLFSVVLLFLPCWLPFILYKIYFIIIFILSGFKYRSLWVGILAAISTLIQFVGYGMGFLRSQILKPNRS